MQLPFYTAVHHCSVPPPSLRLVLWPGICTLHLHCPFFVAWWISEPNFIHYQVAKVLFLNTYWSFETFEPLKIKLYTRPQFWVAYLNRPRWIDNIVFSHCIAITVLRFYTNNKVSPAPRSLWSYLLAVLNLSNGAVGGAFGN